MLARASRGYSDSNSGEYGVAGARAREAPLLVHSWRCNTLSTPAPCMGGATGGRGGGGGGAWWSAGALVSRPRPQRWHCSGQRLV